MFQLTPLSIYLSLQSSVTTRLAHFHFSRLLLPWTCTIKLSQRHCLPYRQHFHSSLSPSLTWYSKVISNSRSFSNFTFSIYLNSLVSLCSFLASIQSSLQVKAFPGGKIFSCLLFGIPNLFAFEFEWVLEKHSLRGEEKARLNFQTNPTRPSLRRTASESRRIWRRQFTDCLILVRKYLLLLHLA